MKKQITGNHEIQNLPKRKVLTLSCDSRPDIFDYYYGRPERILDAMSTFMKLDKAMEKGSLKIDIGILKEEDGDDNNS